MGEQSFEDRVAALEEHVVVSRPTAEEYLARAELALAVGDQAEARHCLTMAKISASNDRLDKMIDRLERRDFDGDWEDDDDA